MMDGEEVVERARSLVGTRFRPQGRSPKMGLDCVGVAAAATGIDPAKLRRDYRMRGVGLERIEDGLLELGFVPVPQGWQRPGDIMVMQAGPQQLHIGVITPEGLVHADAGLGRVVERPGRPPWAILGIWRSIDTNEGKAG